MPREIISLNTSRIRLERRPAVVTVSPNLRRTFQYGFRSLFANPRYDKLIEAPGEAGKLQNFKDLGQILVRTPFATEYAEVYANDAKEPIILFITNQNYIRETLYPNEGEDSEAAMQRLIFFNKAALVLLREAEVNPRVLHAVDWPTALSLAYTKMGNFPPKTLFTFMDARYQGLYPKEFMRLLDIVDGSKSEAYFRRHLEYYGQLSLAKLGLLNADRVVTGSREHIDEVVSNLRPEGGDWGGFAGIFKQLSTEGRLNFLLHSNSALQRLKKINLENPTPEECDTLLSAAVVYEVRYDQLSPRYRAEAITHQALQQLIVGRTEIDFRVLAQFQKILESEHFSSAEKSLIQKVCYEFGSSELIKFLSARLDALEQAKKEQNDDRAAQIDAQIKNLFQQIIELDLDWKLFKDVARKTLYGKPKSFQRLEAIEPYPLNENNPDIIARGTEFLKSGDSGFSPLMVLTMSGGLGQRFSYSVALDHENRTVGLPEQIFSREVNEALTGMGLLQTRDEKKDAVWLVPFDRLAELQPLMSSPFNDKLFNLIGSALAERQASVPLIKGMYITPGQPYSLFEQQARSLSRLESESGKKIYWTVMTSQENHELIKLYFESNLRDGKYFGALDPAQVIFRSQGNNPGIKKNGDSIDIHIKPNGEIYSATNGHGGVYGVAREALAEIKERTGHTVEEILACNIENVLFNYQLGNPDFVASWLGFKLSRGDMVTGLAAAKASPTEAMGIFAKGDNVEQIIEYNHPSFNAFKAFAFESARRGDIYFVRDTKGRVLVMEQDGFEKIFTSAVTEENWMNAVDFDKKTNRIRGGKLLKGYTPLGLHEIKDEDQVFMTELADERIVISGAPFLARDLLKELGQVQLKYRLGNTNIFVLSRRFVDLVNEHPEIAVGEEYKPGDTPNPEVKKVERMIFGPLPNIFHYETLAEVIKDYGGDLGISVVESPREDCFEPIKANPDVEVVVRALADLLRRIPGLDDH